MKKYLIVILILAVIGIAFAIWRLPVKNNNPENLLGGDRDEHGCIGSAGYSWCEAKQKCLRIFEEPCMEPAEESALIEKMEELLGNKYSKNPAEFNVSIRRYSPGYVRGDITLMDKDGNPAAGGYFFAAKINEKWRIVFDGNGEIPCNLSEYGFPAEMLSDCAE